MYIYKKRIYDDESSSLRLVYSLYMFTHVLYSRKFQLKFETKIINTDSNSDRIMGYDKQDKSSLLEASQVEMKASEEIQHIGDRLEWLKKHKKMYNLTDEESIMIEEAILTLNEIPTSVTRSWTNYSRKIKKWQLQI